ncbi:hypothetical protein JM18_001012 [Phytophthora kernoviae]|uniref:BED-type domain-containing protein n=2 Tax=Phytophthora kernoviae TaxID=325452 RepID=A0A8T0M850_9STRA|nr:hypothetical protein G195_003076 [Phytophthora kernoviae 00238/432]KAG2529886.1 hypothetical protein JM16_001720 [Phytophthora kernoviae]KAG2531786.1 hypothetical protein JM18_001012 [Phytophthora kernoviae]
MTDETEVEIVTRLQAVDIRDLYPDLAAEDTSSRVCLLCAAKLKDKTHNLTRHLERHHAGALLQLLEQRNQASPALLASKSKRVQQEKTAAKQPAGQTEDALIKAGDAKLALARWLAQEQLPVDLVEKASFRDFVEALNDQFNPPKREELRQLLGALVSGQEDSKHRLGVGSSGENGDELGTAVEMMALRATCRCVEDSPLVSYSRVACDIPERGEAKVRVLRAAASLFDAQACRGKILGKNGVLGRSFIGVVVDVQLPLQDATRASVNIFDKVVASPYIAHDESPDQQVSDPQNAQSCLGVSASSGALAEYVVLPVMNLCVVPSSIPNDLALLADDMAVVLSVVQELLQRQSTNVAILSDGPATCLTSLLTRRFQYASTTPLDIYQSAAVAHVLSRQNELAADICVDLIGSEASIDVATSVVQSMGCVVLVDRSRLELKPRITVAMDLNAVVVRELEVVSVHDCRDRLHEAVEYLGKQAQDPLQAAELRASLLPSVPLHQVLDELQAVAQDAMEAKYLQVEF